MAWFFLSLYLFLLLIIMIMCYSAAISNWVSPSKVPRSYGNYGVEPGVTGTPLSNKYRYDTSGLLDATNRCDRDTLCTSFYYSNGMMVYLEDNDNRYQAPSGGIYKRQINLKSEQ
jgi:hypothetical protein